MSLEDYFPPTPPPPQPPAAPKDDCLTKTKIGSILSLVFDLHNHLKSINTSAVSSVSSHDNDPDSLLLKAIEKAARLAATTTSSNTATTPHSDEKHEYTIDVVTPLIVGLFVAAILGWMLIRYKISAHTRSNYNGSIYCCPDECFDFCAKLCKCNFKLNVTQFLAKHRRDGASGAAGALSSAAAVNAKGSVTGGLLGKRLSSAAISVRSGHMSLTNPQIIIRLIFFFRNRKFPVINTQRSETKFMI
jgi:hypothetical protein